MDRLETQHGNWPVPTAGSRSWPTKRPVRQSSPPARCSWRAPERALLRTSDCPFLSARAAPYAQRKRTSTNSAAIGLPSEWWLFGSCAASMCSLPCGSYRCVSITLVWSQSLLSFGRIIPPSPLLSILEPRAAARRAQSSSPLRSMSTNRAMTDCFIVANGSGESSCSDAHVSSLAIALFRQTGRVLRVRRSVAKTFRL